jgi:hypothetical protein
LRPPTPGGLTVWLTLGPPPHLPACRGEARRAGLQAAEVLLLPVPHLPLLVHGLWAALEAPRVALVLVDARGSEAEVARLLTSRRFYGLLRQKQAQRGARLVLLGDTRG